MRSGDIGKEIEYVVNCELQSDHGSRITLLNQIFQHFVLTNKFFLHCTPHHLQKVFFFAQVFLYFLVQRFQTSFYLQTNYKTKKSNHFEYSYRTSRILTDNFS